MIRWTHKVYDAFSEEARLERVTPGHMLKRYDAWVENGWLHFRDKKLKTLFLLKYGHIL